MEDKIIGSESAPVPGKGILASDGEAQPQKAIEAATNTVDIASGIYHATRYGGLDTVPQSFEEVNGHWTTIRSANPFEVLYLDYKQYRLITPETVKKNYDILLAFWQGKMRLMMGGAREKIKARYGEDTVNTAPKVLEAAYNKLKTTEGVELYYKELETKRYNAGISAIQEIIELSIEDGELTKQEANRIIAKGIKNGLDENEVRNHLLQLIQQQGFAPRSSVKSDDVFDNQWMTEAKKKQNRARETEWLGVAVSSLEEAGAVTFSQKEKAYQRLANANYLPVVVTRLTNDNKGFEFEEIINKEKDADRRFLKVVYRLNASLPFLVGNRSFKNIKEIVIATAGDYSLYADFYYSFQKNYVQIWLTETDPAAAALFTSGTAYTDFLRFLFRADSTHPFYLKENRFATPQQMAAAANKQIGLWTLIAGGMHHNELPVWFEGIGRYDWIDKYNERLNSFIDSSYHDAHDKEMAAVQTLLQIIDETAPPPEIRMEPTAIQMLDVEGSNKVQYTVQLQLANTGFVKVQLYLSTAIAGISLSEKEAALHSQNAVTAQQFYLYVDGMTLVKDKLYTLNIIAETLYQQVAIPVKIKVVFPKKTYTRLLIKYGAIGAAFFAVTRFLAAWLSGYDGWFSTSGSYLSLDTSESYLPKNYFLYVLLVAVFIGGLIASFFIIKKREKL